ncbi:vegetative cell wall protein gp1-like [Triticum dicoccoides]|uniref:vegetative cell wall protein gp1-like n=1 Tax=Triticum dicoccoides TaxID=85692 RepID=UPI00188EC1FF|nr:vegetative cell wall protein gp1-like [Triticum dicoccoides]
MRPANPHRDPDPPAATSSVPEAQPPLALVREHAPEELEQGSPDPAAAALPGSFSPHLLPCASISRSPAGDEQQHLQELRLLSRAPRELTQPLPRSTPPDRVAFAPFTSWPPEASIARVAGAAPCAARTCPSISSAPRPRPPSDLAGRSPEQSIQIEPWHRPRFFPTPWMGAPLGSSPPPGSSASPETSCAAPPESLLAGLCFSCSRSSAAGLCSLCIEQRGFARPAPLTRRPAAALKPSRWISPPPPPTWAWPMGEAPAPPFFSFLLGLLQPDLAQCCFFFLLRICLFPRVCSFAE